MGEGPLAPAQDRQGETGGWWDRGRRGETGGALIKVLRICSACNWGNTNRSEFIWGSFWGESQRLRKPWRRRGLGRTLIYRRRTERRRNGRPALPTLTSCPPVCVCVSVLLTVGRHRTLVGQTMWWRRFVLPIERGGGRAWEGGRGGRLRAGERTDGWLVVQRKRQQLQRRGDLEKKKKKTRVRPSLRTPSGRQSHS